MNAPPPEPRFVRDRPHLVHCADPLLIDLRLLRVKIRVAIRVEIAEVVPLGRAPEGVHARRPSWWSFEPVVVPL